MRKSRFTPGQIIGFLKQAEAGMVVTGLFRQHGFSDATFYKWRAKYGGMEAAGAQHLKALEAENGRLKKLLVEAHLDIEALKIGFGVNASPATQTRGGAQVPRGQVPTALRQPLERAFAPNEVGSTDFVSDALASGRKLQCLVIADDFTHECADIAVDHGIGGPYVTRTLGQAA